MSNHNNQLRTSSGLLYPASVAFTVAFATLLLQLVQTRIYGVVFWNHLVYFIVSIALLGFGISGTWLAFGKNTFVARVLTLRNAAFLFVVTTIFAALVAPRLVIGIAPLAGGASTIAQLLIAYSVAVLPYFFGGWMLGATFRDYADRIFVLYAVDLVGAGIGCLVFLATMQPLGAIHLIVLICAVTALPPFIKDIGRPSTKGLAASVAVVLAVIVWKESQFNGWIVPEPTKAFHSLYADLGENDTVEWDISEWNTISRIDVRYPDLDPERPFPHGSRQIFIDGDAWTGAVAGDWWKRPHERQYGHMVGHAAPYWFYWDDLDHVLVVGSGGGPDVANAIWAQAKRVDAIEINPTTYRVMLEEYRELSDDLFFQPGVKAYNEEGRSFISRSSDRYDLIQMTGIDTFAALNSGAYVLSENYLYTVDAIKDYIGHLSDRGMLCITRWLDPAETLRLFAVSYEALKQLGYEDPGRHIMLQGSDRATIMVRNIPFTDQELSDYGDYLLEKEATMYYPPLEGHGTIEQARLYVENDEAGNLDEYLASLPYDVSPVDDDSPFFFHFDRIADLVDTFRYRNSAAEMIRGAWPSFTLFALLGATLVASFIFMFLPLSWRGRPKVPGFGLWLIYFSCLGIAFIFLEVALMQRFALLLGHPSRSLALVLAALLVSAGIGSYIRGALNLDLRLALSLLIPLIVVTALFYPALVNLALAWPFLLRALLTVALVTPLGILMGMPFPTGLHLVSQSGSEAVPWMWGVNGGTTVVGSILAIVIAIWVNFTTVILLAGLGYAIALAIYIVQTRAPKAPSTD